MGVEQPSATRRPDVTQATDPVAAPAAGSGGAVILPSERTSASWDDDVMSAARSAAKKKPTGGPVAVPDPAPESEAPPEPAPEPDAATAPDDEVPAARPNAWAAPMNALGGFIRAQRQLAKLSLRDMATMTSVSNAYLSQVERGLHQPSLKVLHSIADALQLDTEQLLTQAGWATQSADQPASANGNTEEAIRTDPRLTPEQRTALLGVYRSFVDGTA
jgi:transcriptional regulator with XRE-family HTH domain